MNIRLMAGAEHGEGSEAAGVLRLFVGLPLAEGLRGAATALLESLRRAAPRGIAWTSAENLHATLKFLGAVEAERLPEVKAAARAAADGFTPFDADAGGLGAFPDWKRPSILWLGCGDPPDLRRLAARTEDAFAALGFPREERGFHPHLTLGRVKDPAAAAPLRRIAEREAPRLGTWRVDAVAVFRSILGPRGTAYVPLETTLLRGAPAPGARAPAPEGSDVRQGSERGP